ncbi:helix-turn-helix domain-containing protein [Clostridium butyricum]|uniref:helix-turn-helix domain-containing protein n=1 Tax=Clostridium butyricum TaxID=1492 RepID=UPI003D331D5A
MVDKIFSERLKESRKNKNLTQQQLADLINSEWYELKKKVSRASIAKYERGDTKPNMYTLSVISHVLDVDVDFLLGKSDEKHIQITNESLNKLISTLNSIIYKDDTNTNYILWKILDYWSSSIKQSINHDFLDLYSKIVQLISEELNYSVNSNDLNNLKNLQKSILKNRKKRFVESEKKFISDNIPDILEYVKIFGLDELDNTDKKMLKTYYSNTDIQDIPEIIQDIFKNNENTPST